MDSAPQFVWEGIGAFTSDHAPILIILGGVWPPVKAGRSPQRLDFENADWGKRRAEIIGNMGNFHVIGNFATDVRNFTKIVLVCADISISQTNTRGATTNFVPPEAKRLRRERELGYATGSAETQEKIGELSRSITEAVSESKRQKWRELRKKTNYNSDPKADMRVTISLSGIS